MIYSKIISVGSYLPEKILTNADLEKIVDTTDEWIIQRTGIKQRHIANQNQKTSDMAYEASKKAIEKANIDKNSIDLIIFATTTPDKKMPSTGAILQSKLQISNNCPCFDIQAVCSGFVYAIEVADTMIKSGKYKRALVVGADKNSSILDWSDRNTCVLFGDGAGCVILDAVENQKENLDKSFSHIMGSKIQTQGEHHGLLFADEFIQMNGQEVFKHAIKKMSSSIQDGLNFYEINSNEVSLIIPHQANYRIITKVAENLKIDESKVIMTMSIHGNTSAASIPLALDYAIENNKLKQGDFIIFEALGSGLTWGFNFIIF